MSDQSEQTKEVSTATLRIEGTRKVVVIEFPDTEDMPNDSDLSHAIYTGLVNHGYDAEITVVGKDKALWFPDKNAFVTFES